MACLGPFLDKVFNNGLQRVLESGNALAAITFVAGHPFGCWAVHDIA
jgi:hypothetical protein